MMKKMALAVKAHHGSRFCQLPFCHTLEAELLGGKTLLGDERSGPRVRECRYASLEEILDQKAWGIEGECAYRLRATLDAVRDLQRSGEKILFQVTGPITILNSLVNPDYLFRTLLKEPDLVQKALKRLGQDILRIMKLAERQEAHYISYADSSGSIGIVGPKVAARIVKDFTAEFLYTADCELEQETMLLLCPKTALSLIGTETAEWEEWILPEPMEYLEAAEYMNDTHQIRFGGQDCVNHLDPAIRKKVFRQLILTKAGGGSCL